MDTWLLFLLGAILPHTLLKGYLFSVIALIIRHGGKRVGADSPQSQLASEWLDTAQQLRSLISGCFDNIPGKSFLHHLITKSGKYTDCFH